jgi:transposase
MDSDRPTREKMILMYSKALPGIPRETVRAATAVFGRGNFYILVGDHLEGILEGERPSKLEAVVPPLITFFQFVEGLTDLQAIDAVRTRTDWKFALHLSLVPARLDESVLCRFRQKILCDPIHQREFQRLIDRLLVFAPTSRHRQTLKSQELVSIVCSLNRLQLAQQAMNRALEVLAVQFPHWLRKNALPHWYGRYNPSVPRLDVPIVPGQQQLLMEGIGSDIQQLLEKVHQSGLREVNALHELRALDRMCSQPFQGVNREGEIQLETLSSKDCNLCFYREAGRRGGT